MQVLLPPNRIEIQPIKVINKPEEEAKEAEELGKPRAAGPLAEPHTEPEEEAKEAKELRGSLAAEPHAEPEEETDETLPDRVKELGRSHAAEPHAEPEESVDEDEKSDEELTEDKSSLPDRVKELNRNDVLFTEICEYLANPTDHNRPTDVYLHGSRAANGLLYKDNKLWVANDLRLDVI